MYQKIIFILLLGFSSVSFSLVDMKVREYSQTWKDLKILSDTRKYQVNSNGVFGKNWCSPFDVKPKCQDLNLSKKWVKVIKEGKIVKIKSKDLKYSFDLVYNNQGLISKILKDNKVLSSFEYKDNQISKALNEWGSSYQYEYNDKGHLIKTFYPDKSFIEIGYNSQNEVISFKDRESCIETYSYNEEVKSDKEYKYWTHTLKTCDKKIIADIKYFFEMKYSQRLKNKYLSKVKVIGSPRQFKNIEFNDKSQIVTSYDENNNSTHFTYDKNDRLIKKQQNTQFIHYSYQGKNLKKVTASDKSLNHSYSISFLYDKNSNLEKAIDSDGKFVKLKYNKDNQIEVIEDRSKQTLLLSYDPRFKKPETIYLNNKESIKVTYNNDGTINQVVSPEGTQKAFKIASIFSEMLSLVSPANME